MAIREYSDDVLAGIVPVPGWDANKYSRGTVVLLVGSERYPGAACLAAAASQRAGAGYTQVYTAREAMQTVQRYRPSLVVSSFADFLLEKPRASEKGKPCAYVVGSGFDAASDEANGLLFSLLARAQAPVLVDGGAFKALSSEAGRELCRQRFIDGCVTVITPHAGEAITLASALGFHRGEAAAMAQALSQAYGVTAVLKGPNTYISDGEGCFKMDEGTPALAKAGTGDVLAGIIGAFLAQGLDPIDASVLATTLHARAGRLAAASLCPLSVTAEDLIDQFPAAVRTLLDASRQAEHTEA